MIRDDNFFSICNKFKTYLRRKLFFLRVLTSLRPLVPLISKSFILPSPFPFFSHSTAHRPSTGRRDLHSTVIVWPNLRGDTDTLYRTLGEKQVPVRLTQAIQVFINFFRKTNIIHFILQLFYHQLLLLFFLKCGDLYNSCVENPHFKTHSHFIPTKS